MVPRHIFIATFLLLVSSPVLAVEDCEMNGEHVNPANGSTYAGKTGIMKCKDRDSGKLVRETEYRNGKALGYRKSIDFSGNTSVGSFNENGNRDGEFKQYDPSGKLTAEERYSDGSAVGLQTQYYPNGQVRRRSFYEAPRGASVSLEYNDRGQLTQVRCADKSLLAEDRALCGFDGRPAEVKLYNSRGDQTATVRHENGKRVAYSAFTASGTTARSDEIQGDKRVTRENYPDGKLKIETIVAGGYKQSERELTQSGTPLRETKWQQGRKSEESLWYLNGQPRSKTRWSGENDYVQQLFGDDGVIRAEATYEKGRITRRKTYKDGKLAADEELYEDGSRKSLRKVE